MVMVNWFCDKLRVFKGEIVSMFATTPTGACLSTKTSYWWRRMPNFHADKTKHKNSVFPYSSTRIQLIYQIYNIFQFTIIKIFFLFFFFFGFLFILLGSYVASNILLLSWLEKCVPYTVYLLYFIQRAKFIIHFFLIPSSLPSQQNNEM